MQRTSRMPGPGVDVHVRECSAMGTEIEYDAVEPDPLRARFLNAGMRVLARDGYAGFKQSAVCAETGLTTGAFYHSFKSWKVFETELIAFWRAETTEKTAAWVLSLPELRARVEAMINAALDLPHETEAAIRVWATSDPTVRLELRAVDAQRVDSVVKALSELGINPEHARHLAKTASLLVTGYQCSSSQLSEIEWALRTLAASDRELSGALALADAS